MHCRCGCDPRDPIHAGLGESSFPAIRSGTLYFRILSDTFAGCRWLGGAVVDGAGWIRGSGPDDGPPADRGELVGVARAAVAAVASGVVWLSRLALKLNKSG